MARLSVGLDLGQARDYSALAIVEHVCTRENDQRHNRQVGDGWNPHGDWRFDVRHLERIELGTPYPVVVERVATLMSTPELRDDANLFIDNTGVGRPIFDLFNDAHRAGRLPRWATPVTITAEIKLNLVTGLEAALQTGRLRFASRDPLLERALHELKAFRVKLSATGHPTFEAERESDHDDLVIALALACAYGGRGQPRHTGEPVERRPVRRRAWIDDPDGGEVF